MKNMLALAGPMLIIAVLLALPVPVFAEDVAVTDPASTVTPDLLTSNPNPYFILSRCEFNDGAAALDPSASGNERICTFQTTKEGCEQYQFCWWRDTTNQNAISQHTVDEFTDQVINLYDSSTLKVYSYLAPGPSNVVLMVSGSEYIIVGCGGGANEATYAKNRLASLTTGKTLRGIVITDVNPDAIWGCKAWATQQIYAPLYAHSQFEEELQENFLVETALMDRIQHMYGTFLIWGSNAFIGSGTAKQFRAVPPQILVNPTVYLSAPTDISLGGNTISLIPVVADQSNLMVRLPGPDILIAPFFGKYLPDAGALTRPVRNSITKWIETLDSLREMAPSVLVPLHGTPINTADEVLSAILVQRDSLQSLRDQTLDKINQGWSLDDMASTIKLPDTLAVSPYAKPFASNEPSIVRQVYHYYMGWFDGNPAHLQSLSSAERAGRLIALAGGESQALKYIDKCVTEHTREGLIMALEVIDALERVAPSDRLYALHIQTLKMLAFDAESAYVRNYYLSKLQDLTVATLLNTTMTPQ